MPNEYLVSYYALSIYPSVPMSETINIIRVWLIYNNLSDGEVIEYLLCVFLKIVSTLVLCSR